MIIHISYVLEDFPVSVNGVSAVFMQFIIAWHWGTLLLVLFWYIYDPFTVSQIILCVGDLVTHHTSQHKGITHFR